MIKENYFRYRNFCSLNQWYWERRSSTMRIKKKKLFKLSKLIEHYSLSPITQK